MYIWEQWETDMARTLKDHEEVCQERMRNIESKFDSIDAKIDEIRKEIDGFKTFLLKLAFKSFMGLILAISAAVFVIKM
jgi:chromosome segregation ATPase